MFGTKLLTFIEDFNRINCMEACRSQATLVGLSAQSGLRCGYDRGHNRVFEKREVRSLGPFVER